MIKNYISNTSLTSLKRLSLVLLIFSTIRALSQPTLTLMPVITAGLSEPMQLVNAGDGSNRIFIVQKGGNILTFSSTYSLLSVFVTVSNITNDGERGLLSMAFHPDYENNGLFYVYYTNASGNLELARYKVSANPNVADANSKVVLITIPHPTNTNHNGGELHFGADGFLYLSTGDGGGAGDTPNNAQNTSVLLGKILRFNVNTSNVAPYYTIPPGNPYNNEIYDLGLRNPYRWSFDRQTNDMWIGDVGQNSWEEIDFRPAGAAPGLNFGWRCYEGNATYNTNGCGPISNYVFPVHTYPTQSPAASVTGGLVYRGNDYPALQGWYVAADFYWGTFYKIIPDGMGGFSTSTQSLSPTGIVDFGETENGEAYVVSHTDNSVFKLGATNVAGIAESFAAKYKVSYSVNNGNLDLSIDPQAEYYALEIININGTVVSQQELEKESNSVQTPIHQLAKGIYMFRLSGTSNSYTHKFVIE